MNDIRQIYISLLTPSAALIEAMGRIDGDILVLGAGGKMGPSLCILARQAAMLAGRSGRIIAVSRFSGEPVRSRLEKAGVETITADLLEEGELGRLPDAANVIYLAGTKFGTSGHEPWTWAMNTWLPGMVARRYRSSRIVAFSTGNVYPLVDIHTGGATEEVAPMPVGEYAQSCLGRERIFQHFAAMHGTPLLIYRLNYANDVSYGILSEIARAVYNEESVDLRMGSVNLIWQRDANELALRCLLHCESPARILNVTGPETVSVRWLASEFGRIFQKSPVFTGEEQATALLSNAAESFRLFGYPPTSLKTMTALIADWVRQGGETLNKPTHFQQRDGRY